MKGCLLLLHTLDYLQSMLLLIREQHLDDNAYRSGQLNTPHLCAGCVLCCCCRSWFVCRSWSGAGACRGLGCSRTGSHSCIVGLTLLGSLSIARLHCCLHMGCNWGGIICRRAKMHVVSCVCRMSSGGPRSDAATAHSTRSCATSACLVHYFLHCFLHGIQDFCIRFPHLAL